MNPQKRNLLFAAALLLSGVAQSVHAEDFNITVPVRVSGIPPNVASLIVRCFAVVLPAGAAAPTSQIGLSTVNQAITGGAFNGNLTARFNAVPGKLASSATHYQCTGQFQGTDRGFSVGYFVNGGERDSPFPLAVGAPFNLSTGWRPLPP